MLLNTERKTEIAFGAGVLGLVIVFAFAGEAFLRLRAEVQVDWDGIRKAAMVEDEAAALDRFVPGAVFDNIRVNRLGFTSPEIEVPKPDSTIRLAFLGDSVVLGAALQQDQRLASQITRAVEAAIPSCDIDYVTIAGPSYRLSDLTTLLGERRSEIKPDGVVLMTGGVRDIFLTMEENGGPVTGLSAPTDQIEHHSHLYSRIHEVYTTAAITRRDPPDTRFGPIDPNEFAKTYLSMIDALGSTIGDVPVIVIENRGRARADDNDAKLTRTDRILLSQMEGLSVAGLKHLKDLRKSLLQEAATRHGWMYIDPLADMPSTSEFFRDPMHLTAQGVVEIMPVVASHLIDQLRAAEPVPECLGLSEEPRD